MRLATRFDLTFLACSVSLVVAAVSVQRENDERRAAAEARERARASLGAIVAGIDAELDSLTSRARAIALARGRDAAASRLAAGAAARPVEAAAAVSVFACRPGRAAVCIAHADREGAAELAAWLGEAEWVALHQALAERRGVLDSPRGHVLGVAVPGAGVGEKIVLVTPLGAPCDALLAGRPAAPRGASFAAELAALPAGAAPADSLERRALEALERGEKEVVTEAGGGAVAVTALEDPSGRPAILLRAASRASGGETGAWRSVAAWLALSLAAAYWTARRFLRRHVLDGVRDLTQRAARIARSERGKLSLECGRDGEIGELAATLSAMLQAIERHRGELSATELRARASGEARSIARSLARALAAVHASARAAAQSAAAGPVAPGSADPGNGGSGEACGASAMRALQSIEAALAHAAAMARSLDEGSSGARVAVGADVAGLLEQAVGIARITVPAGAGIEVALEHGTLPRVSIDEHKLLAVLVQLIGNSFEALLAASREDKRLEIVTYPTDHGRFVIEVNDNGGGITPGELDEIFDAGFTTKPGAAGVGLHWTAGLCREMGIAIGATSEGPGTGASFKLRVPASPPEPAAKEPRPAPALPSPVTPAPSRPSEPPMLVERRRRARQWDD